MTRYLVPFAVFLAGLAVVGWIGAGYVGSNPLALVVAILIAAIYLAGAVELQRYHRGTAALSRAVAGLSDAPAGLDDWLATLPAGLRAAARLRIEGQRVALPGPALAPYLVGLLVLLGMLGTFLGMVATLRGTGVALESAIDLQAMRAALAAPVKGLGFAFGTSVAGVATSAALGLLAALCRRERILAAQQLDARIATTLRPYTQNHQREETLKLLQRQAETMPVLVDRLQAMMASMEQQNRELGDRLAASQGAFHDKTETAYARLASAIEQSLKQGVLDSARAAGEAIQPAVQATMAGLARETAAWQDTLTQAVRQQLDGVAGRFEATTSSVADIWNQALASHQRASDTLTHDLGASLQRFADTFEQRSAGLLDGMAARLDNATDNLSAAWQRAAAEQQQASAALAQDNQRALAAVAASLEQQSAQLLREVGQSHAGLQAQLASQDEQRLAAWNASLGTIADDLRQQWQQTGAQAAGHQKEICDTLAQTARDLSAQTQEHARDTIAEVARLVQTASEAPKAAAEVIAELRQKLSDGMARDNAMLEERSRLLETLGTLLDAVNHASTQQRDAVDALITTSSDLLDRVGTQFIDKVQAETGKLGDVAAQVTGGAVEVASLGEAFGAAVQAFGQSNEKLVEHLQRIETALDKSLARSDEQLAYYVAQAREVVDLSVMSQKQIIEDLQQLASQRAAAGSETA